MCDVYTVKTWIHLVVWLHSISWIRSVYGHGTLNDLFRRFFATVSVPSILKPSVFLCEMCEDDDMRADAVIIVPWYLGKSLLWNAACADTLARSSIRNTITRADAAADHTQTHKRRLQSKQWVRSHTTWNKLWKIWASFLAQKVRLTYNSAR